MAGLLGKYTFDTFVIGPSNRFAHAAALAAAETPGTQYNPLFIYGGVGLGKTHLLQAIGNYALRNHPALKVRYLTLETFTNDFINSLRDDSIEGFKNRYRTVDVLLIDDIQFLQKKEQTQEEFFHTFNTLYDAQKQIVISSDRHPKGLATLEDRLVSRFEWGLITDIQPPDLETRVAILRKKVRADGITLADDDVLMLIASRVPTNIRELEGCLTRVVAFSSFTKRPIDVDLAREVLKDIPETPSTRVTIDLILSTVAEATGVSVTEITGDKRSRPVVESRHLVMYLARELTDASLPKIGDRIGGPRSHHRPSRRREDRETHARRPGDVQPGAAAHHEGQECTVMVRPQRLSILAGESVDYPPLSPRTFRPLRTTFDYPYGPPQTSPPQAHAATRLPRGSARFLHIFHSTYYTDYISY